MTALNLIEEKIKEAMGLILLDNHTHKGNEGNFSVAWASLDKAIQHVRDAYND